MSLASLPGLRGPDYEGDGYDDCESLCSYYSLTELPETDPVRRVAAAEVRRQAIAMPVQPRGGCKYPEIFGNVEKIPLRAPGPWVEYPLLASAPYISGKPGPARVVASADGYSGCDVIYHPEKDLGKFIQATYRPRGYHRALSAYMATIDAYPMPCQMGYAAYQGFEWQGQGYGQAPWQMAAHIPAQSGYGPQFQPQYGETYPYMVSPTPYSWSQYPVHILPGVEIR